MFAPVEDRDEPGQGFTHKHGDIVTISSPKLGALVNRVGRSDKIPPWEFGALALMRNLAGAGPAVSRAECCRSGRGPGSISGSARPATPSAITTSRSGSAAPRNSTKRCGAGFAADHDAAVSGALAHWEDAPRKRAGAGHAARPGAAPHLPQHKPRLGQRSSRAGRREPGARKGFDRAVPPAWRLFFYLPFEHSENLEDQRRGLELILAIPPVPGRPGDGRMTRLHLEIIERFGRFPHRNAILGRLSTPEELAFLAECEHRFGQPSRPEPFPPTAGLTPGGGIVRVPPRSGGGENMRHRVTRQLLLNVRISPQIPFQCLVERFRRSRMAAFAISIENNFFALSSMPFRCAPAGAFLD